MCVSSILFYIIICVGVWFIRYETIYIKCQMQKGILESDGKISERDGCQIIKTLVRQHQILFYFYARKYEGLLYMINFKLKEEMTFNMNICSHPPKLGWVFWAVDKLYTYTYIDHPFRVSIVIQCVIQCILKVLLDIF